MSTHFKKQTKINPGVLSDYPGFIKRLTFLLLCVERVRVPVDTHSDNSIAGYELYADYLIEPNLRSGPSNPTYFGVNRGFIQSSSVLLIRFN